MTLANYEDGGDPIVMLAAIVKAMIAFTTIIRVGVNYLDCHCIITKQLQTGVCSAGDHTSGEVEMGEGKTVLGAQRIFSTVWGYFAVADTCFELLLGQQLPYIPHTFRPQVLCLKDGQPQTQSPRQVIVP